MKVLSLHRMTMLLAMVLLGGVVYLLPNGSNYLVGPDPYWTGYLLLAVLLVLTSLHFRKKISFLPLGSMATWLRIHVVLGIVAGLWFGHHVSWRLPNGRFESLLYGLFAATWLSGIVGLFLSRRVPRKLTKLREQFLFDEIPSLRRQVAADAGRLVENLARQSAPCAVADFYMRTLAPYFEQPVPIKQYVWCTGRTRNQLRNELATLRRYGNATEQEAQEQLARMIDRRDDLDFHAIHQGRLRIWLFVHLGLTYPLLVMATWHTVMVHAFRGVG